jgi:hypothetical protein
MARDPACVVRRHRLPARRHARRAVAIDSSSTTRLGRAAAPRFDVRHHPAASFNHGLTRNRAIEQSSGDAIVLIV